MILFFMKNKMFLLYFTVSMALFSGCGKEINNSISGKDNIEISNEGKNKSALIMKSHIKKVKILCRKTIVNTCTCIGEEKVICTTKVCQ